MSIFNKEIVNEVPILDIIDICNIGMRYIDTDPWYISSDVNWNHYDDLFISDARGCEVLALSFGENPKSLFISFKELFHQDSPQSDYSIRHLLMESCETIKLDEFLTPPHVSPDKFYKSCFRLITDNICSKVLRPKNEIMYGKHTFESIHDDHSSCCFELKWCKWNEYFLTSSVNPRIETVTPTFDLDPFSNPIYTHANPMEGYIIEPISIAICFDIFLNQ